MLTTLPPAPPSIRRPACARASVRLAAAPGSFIQRTIDVRDMVPGLGPLLVSAQSQLLLDTRPSSCPVTHSGAELGLRQQRDVRLGVGAPGVEARRDVGLVVPPLIAEIGQLQRQPLQAVLGGGGGIPRRLGRLKHRPVRALWQVQHGPQSRAHTMGCS